MGLEIQLRGLLQQEILDLGDLKLQRYNRFKIELLKARKGMTRIKKIETPSKKIWRDDLKNLIEAKINGFIYGMKANIDGIEEELKGNKEDLKKDMKGLKEGWTKLLQERLPNREKVVEETHDENKRNVNHDFIESNVRLKMVAIFQTSI